MVTCEAPDPARPGQDPVLFPLYARCVKGDVRTAYTPWLLYVHSPLGQGTAHLLHQTAGA